MHIGMIAGVVSLGSAAMGQITYNAQTRSVTAEVNFSGETISAPGFGVFNETASDSVSNPWGGASAVAWQRSTLGAWSISAGSDVSASDNSRDSAVGRSIFDVTFTLATLSDVELSGVLDSVPDFMGGGFTEIQLERVGGPVLVRYDGSGIEPGDPWRVDFSGAAAFRSTLAAGQYRLIARISDSGSAAGASYNFMLTVPTPGSLGLLGAGVLVGLRRKR